MIAPKLIHYLENVLSNKIIAIQRLFGGDINDVFALTTKSGKWVVKINVATKFPQMFQAENLGLELLKKTKTFSIPEVVKIGEVDNVSFLLMKYIEQGKKSVNFWSMFGKQLAALHRNSQNTFGLEKDNFIGSLPQYNYHCRSAADFYIEQRLQPQFTMAGQRGFVFDNLNACYRNMRDEIPNEASSLIHGDLWGGNFMVNEQGLPCLIDPAVAYASREQDIAMMHLFGGFDTQLFEIYNEEFPLQQGWKDRLPLFQLYYLLVHLNLFGDSYYQSVKRIVDKYQ